MSFKIYCVGKVKNKSLLNEINELKKRVSRLEIVELKEVKDKNPEVLKKKEFEVVKKFIDKSNFNVLLWEFGSEFNTREFYSKFSRVDRDVCFFVTGAYGPSEEFKKVVDMKLSLSKMTFTHEQALYMLVEQVYRFECLKKGVNYNK